MLERIGSVDYASLSEPCKDAFLVIDLLKSKNSEIIVGEVGVGIGSTTVEIARMLDNRGKLYIFDFTHIVNELRDDLLKLGYFNIFAFGSTKHTYDSYVWQLLKLARHLENNGNRQIFDFIYLDGAHTFLHDAGAAAACKALLKTNGYILFDDRDWTFQKSPTMNPKKLPIVESWYTNEQLLTPHIRLVCEVIMDSDSRFARENFGGEINFSRVLYKKISD